MAMLVDSPPMQPIAKSGVVSPLSENHSTPSPRPSKQWKRLPTPSAGQKRLSTPTAGQTSLPTQFNRQRIISHGPSTSASIPSRYQTFFYANQETRGFNSQAPRFQTHLSIDDNPGPGSYGTPHDSIKLDPASFSKKGTSGFASKKARFSRATGRQKVGPGSYNPQPVENNQAFSRAGVTSVFHSPIAVKTDSYDPSPAPNSYNCNDKIVAKNNLVTGEAAFKSRTSRDALTLHTVKNPGPSQYTISVSDQLLHPSSCSYNSVFNSKSDRAFPKPHKGPGPADYHPTMVDTTVTRTVPYFLQKYYLCFSSPALPLPPPRPPPGPGHYEVQNNMANSTQSGCGAVFKSTTGRWTNNLTNKSELGPTSYEPVINGKKKSYLLNVHRKWLPP